MQKTYTVRAYRRCFVDRQHKVQTCEVYDTDVDQFGELILPQDKYIPAVDGSDSIQQSGEWNLTSNEQLNALLATGDVPQEKIETSPSIPSLSMLMKMTRVYQPNESSRSPLSTSTDEFEVPIILQQPKYSK